MRIRAHQCKMCGEIDPKMFRGTMKTRCYECFKLWQKDKYEELKKNVLDRAVLCACGDDDPQNFTANNSVTCKNCLNEKAKKVYADNRREKLAREEMTLQQKKIRFLKESSE